MTVITRLPIHFTLYDKCIEEMSCDYFLSFDETKSENWYANDDPYEI